MYRDLDGDMLAVVELWQERFGEPPPILTDPELMWSVLRSTSAELRDASAKRT